MVVDDHGKVVDGYHRCYSAIARGETEIGVVLAT